jgi:hypothetical protein
VSGGIGAGRGVNDQHTDTLGSDNTNTGYDDQGTHATNDAYTSSLPMHTHRITLYHRIANTRIRGEYHPQKGVQTPPILPNIPPL